MTFSIIAMLFPKHYLNEKMFKSMYYCLNILILFLYIYILDEIMFFLILIYVARSVI